LNKLEANILEAAFLIELEFLNGRSLLANVPVRSIISYS
jgi:adenine/guanine phosphoribosyltransferase-like PRPP-binding protein